jgi:ABC-type transport system involved in cytochrome c biogenesis permease component
VLSFPLVTRELRVQSRNRATYSARTGWGVAAVAVLVFFTWSFPNQSANGKYLLSAVHLCLAAMIFILAPIGAADSISREKREGTLGLLFLTHLTPKQLVLGKLASHFIRLFYFAFMIVPFLVIPVMMGGVDSQDFLLSFVTLLSLAAIGLSAGLIASALCVSFAGALGAAIFLTALLVLITGSSLMNVGLLLFPNRFGEPDLALRIFVFGPALFTFPLISRDIAGMGLGSRTFFWFIEGGLAALSIFFLRFAFWFSARRLARRSEFAGETKRQAEFRQKFLTPVVWRSTFRRFMRRSLDRNPFIWLEYRTAWARAARTGMVLLLVVVETGIFMELPSRTEFVGLHFMILFVLLVFLTLKSSSSFQREKECGAFELLLVTPLTETEIVRGRLRAVAGYYGPFVVLLAVIGGYGFYWMESSGYEEPQLSAAVNFVSVCGSILSVPASGLFFALRYRTFVPALLWTAGVAVLAPICVWAAFNGMLWYGAMRAQWPFAMLLEQTLRTTWWPVVLTVAAYHLFVAGASLLSSVQILRDRNFAAAEIS